MKRLVSHRGRAARSRQDSAVFHADLGQDQTSKYMDAVRDTMKGMVRGTVAARVRDDLRPGVLMASSRRHGIFFETNESRILVVRVLHESMDYRRHLNPSAAPDEDD